MATFNILSSCICRDAFGFQVDNAHKIVTFLQSTSALTWYEYPNKPIKPIDISIFEDITVLSNFQKKCLLNDYNKTVFDNFTEKTDFFITDMTEFASMPLGKEVYENGQEHYFTFSKWFNNAYKSGLKEKLDYKIERINQVDIINDDIIDETMEKYTQWILSKGYKEEEVILVQNKRSTHYIDGELLYRFSGETHREVLNNLLDKIYEAFRKNMPNAHVIKMPVGVLGDTRHKWGLTDLHFSKEYYDYLYKCFDLIATSENSKQEIQKLRDEYSEILLRKKDDCILNTFSYSDGVQLLPYEQEEFVSECYVAPRGAYFYDSSDASAPMGRLNRCFDIIDYSKSRVQIYAKERFFYVDKVECVRGVIGENKEIGKNWKTINSTTVVMFSDTGIVIGHNGKKMNAQTQVIQTIDNTENLPDAVVTFSVYARVKKLNNNNTGGTIALVNANNYNKGKFLVKTDFINTTWERISVTTRLPKGNAFKGLTLCMRAIAGSGDNPIHAIVEFCNPKLEYGTYPTKI